MAFGLRFVAAVMMVAAAVSAEGAAARDDVPPVGKPPPASVLAAAPAASAAPAVVTSSKTSTSSSEVDGEPVCARIKGAEACVSPDDGERPGITIEDMEKDRLHPAVEYYMNGYLGTKYVIHNLARDGEFRGNLQIGKVITFRAAIYEGDSRVRFGRWKTVRNFTKNPVKRETRVTPATARARSKVCTSTGGALVCFAERRTTVFACDTSADLYQARAEYFVGGDPTARFEIQQLAGTNTCGKAEHGDLAISMYRAAVYDEEELVSDQLYRYN